MTDKNTIPKHWQIKKLGAICGIVYGKGLPVKQLKPSGFPVFGANGIIGFNDKYLFEESQVLISCRGAASGKINLSPPKCYVTNNSLVLDIKKKEELDKNYLFFALSIAKKTKLVTGTAQPQVTINNAVELDIPFPPLSEQQAIVSKIEELFSELDNGIAQLKTAQQQLKVYRQSLLKWAFEGKLTSSITNEKLRITNDGLPKGWKWVKIDFLLSDKKKGMGTGPFGTMLKKGEHKKEGVPVLGIENIGQGIFQMPNKIFVSIEKSIELKNFKVKENDIIISRSGTVGEICLLPKRMEGSIISTNLIRVTLNQEIIYPKFFVYLFQGGKVRQQVFDLCKGSSRAFLNQTILNSIDFPYPTLKQQQLIVDEFESKLTVCDKIEETISQSLQQAETLRQSILKKAFEGKLVRSILEHTT